MSLLIGSKEEAREYMYGLLDELKRKRRVANRIKNELLNEYNIPFDITQKIINDVDNYRNSNIKYLFAICEKAALYLRGGNGKILSYFSERELKEMRSTLTQELVEKKEFPYTFKYPAIKINNDDWILPTDMQEIFDLMNNGMIEYNPETQRELKRLFNRDKNKIIEEPLIVESSVSTMVDLIRRRELANTMITLNARVGTADSGMEVDYDENTGKITITKGTLLDCLDGFHRIVSIVRALSVSPEINEKMKLNLLNFDIPKAKNHFAQINTINPVSKSRIMQAGSTNNELIHFISDQLQNNSELKGRVSSADFIHPLDREYLITFKLLYEFIEENFKDVKDKAEAIKVSRFLTNFINELFYAFPNEFLGDFSKSKKETVMTIPTMFLGYFMLAKKAYTENIPIEKVINKLFSVDFSRSNPKWTKRGITKTTGSIKPQVRKFFEEVEI